MNHNSRAAFTMVEIIFVIVIMGILMAVALPRLAAKRDDADASRCAYDVGQLLHEISNSYINDGYWAFKVTEIGDITNVKTGISDSEDGIIEDPDKILDGSSISYRCGGEVIATISGDANGTSYLIVIKDEDPSSSHVAIFAAKKLRHRHGYGPNGTKTFHY